MGRGIFDVASRESLLVAIRDIPNDMRNRRRLSLRFAPLQLGKDSWNKRNALIQAMSMTLQNTTTGHLLDLNFTVYDDTSWSILSVPYFELL